MAQPPVLQSYVDLLMQQAADRAHPSPRMLDRIELAISNRRQADAYLDLVLDKCRVAHPSHHMLARVARLGAALQRVDELQRA